MRVPARGANGRRDPGLTGRAAECQLLDGLLADVRLSHSRALVIHGDAGVGKTELLEYVAAGASGCRLARAAGVQSEMQLAYAGVHQLCAPMLDRLTLLPAPQREALETALGMRVGPAPDRFLVALAVLSLLSEVAAEQPLICLVDDEQWLDRASAQSLAFAARRLQAESVGLIFAARQPTADLSGLPELPVEGLSNAAARALLDSVLTGPLDSRVRDQIVYETGGNPLALIELPRGLSPAELAGGFGLLGAAKIEGSIEGTFRLRAAELPPDSQRLLLLAAAESAGDPVVVWRAATRLGLSAAAAGAVTSAGLADFQPRVRFRHPLVRSAAYRSASLEDRRLVHRTLAEVTDPQSDPDRRAWHLAQATLLPDEAVAAELERSAGRAQGRGGFAAAAAFLQLSTSLTPDPSRRVDRALAAAEAETQVGGFDTASDLLAMAESGSLNAPQQARVDLARAQLAYVNNRGSDAAPLLLKAARHLKLIDSALSRETYLDALSAAVFAGRLAGPGGGVLEVAEAAEAAPPATASRAPDFMLDGLVASYTRGYAASLPALRGSLAAFGSGMLPEEELRRLWLAAIVAIRVWDEDRWEALSSRHVQLAREAGALSELPLALTSHAYTKLFEGELDDAAALTDEAQSIKEATGSNLAPYGALGVAAFRGDESTTVALIETTRSDVNQRGEGVGVTFAEWAGAVLHNGLGNYQKAAAAAQRAVAFDDDPYSSIWPWPELMEAATRSGERDVAADAYRQFSELTSASGTDFALGVQARCQALLCEGEKAECLYQESITRLGRTRLRVDLSRAHLLYGEWLRRQRRRMHAREQLRTAHRMFESMGMGAFAERARRELQATGETARKRTAASIHTELTPQETQIARLAREGLSNPEIGARLFLSAHTVQYHLRKVFAKLGITSRSQLDRAALGGGAGSLR